jgi:haloacetate dehalogenase
VTLDLADDDAAAARGQRVTAPMLALWGEHGFVGRHYGDVAKIWRGYADTVTGRSLPCGHYLAEEVPLETAALLQEFLAD